MHFFLWLITVATRYRQRESENESAKFQTFLQKKAQVQLKNRWTAKAVWTAMECES